MLALTDFTPENGATLLVPGSHTWPKDRKPTEEEEAQGVMKAGSLVVWAGGLLHAAAENKTDDWRQGLFMSYNLAWLRTEENLNLDVPPHVAKTLSPEIRALIGYEYCGGLGFVDTRLVEREMDEPEGTIARFQAAKL